MLSEWDEFINTIVPDSYADKIIGMIYGHALGNAIGLITKFKFKHDKPKLEFPYKTPVRGFQVCDWSSDTDHLIIAMQSLTAHGLKFSPTDIASRLKKWTKCRFKELGDVSGMGLSATMNMIITHPKFLEDPKYTAVEIWNNSDGKLATNGSLVRSPIAGTIPNINSVELLAADLSMVSHVDPRCVGACVLQSFMIHNLIYRGVNTPNDVDKLLKASVELSRQYIIAGKNHDEELSQWIQVAYTDNLTKLSLDDVAKIGYVFKCLSCSIYALQVVKIALKNGTAPSFKKFILKLAAECGDADANCAVAGATLGAYLGYSNLPLDYISALPHREWLNNIIMQYIKVLAQSDGAS